MTRIRQEQVLTSAIARGAGYFTFWVLLIGTKPVDLAVGMLAAGVATWASLFLLPPDKLNLRLAGLPRYTLHFLRQSVVAGFNVGRVAFSRRMDLSPGFVTYTCRYRQGIQRTAFASITSLVPGTVPVLDDEQGLLYHVLDNRLAICDQLADEETILNGLLPREQAS